VKNKKGKVFICAGLLLIAAAVGITAYNTADSIRADRSAFQAVCAVEEEIEKAATEKEEIEESVTADYMLNPDMDMPYTEIEDRNYIGVLDVPSLNITLPVIDELSYDALKTAPCRYTGTAYKSGFVIAAHNYRGHFGRINKLSQGDEISFTDMDGNVFNYIVEAAESIEPEDIEGMTEEIWDLTLFTCTTGGQYRFAVRCRRADGAAS